MVHICIYRMAIAYGYGFTNHFYLKGQNYERPVRLVDVSLIFRLLTRCFGKI